MSDFAPMTLVMPLGRFEQLQQMLHAPKVSVAPFVPPAGLITSLDLYEAWQRHQGIDAAQFAWVRERDLKGIPLTDRVIAAFPAFAEMDCGGFYNGLHIAMDDGNLWDEAVDFCVRQTAEDGDDEAHALALKLREMTEDERIALYCSLSPGEESDFD